MKKRILMSLMTLWVISSALLALSGCATGIVSNEWIEFCSKSDPPVEKYQAAYECKGDIILEYIVDQNKAYPPKTKKWDAEKGQWINIPPDLHQYWARLNLDELADRSSKGNYTIYRNPLSASKKKKMRELPLIDLRNHVTLNSDGKTEYYATYGYMKQLPEKELPQVFVYVQSTSQQNMLVCYIDPESKKKKTYRNNPYDKFIPASRYPAFLALYPLAVIGDIVTLPLIFMAPGYGF